VTSKKQEGECLPVSTPHKDTLAVAVIDHAACVVTQLQLPTQDSGYLPPAGCADQPRGDAGGHGRSGNFGWPAAIYLLERDLNVVDVPPLMTSRERLSQPGQGKTT